VQLENGDALHKSEKRVCGNREAQEKKENSIKKKKKKKFFSRANAIGSGASFFWFSGPINISLKIELLLVGLFWREKRLVLLLVKDTCLIIPSDHLGIF